MNTDKQAIEEMAEHLIDIQQKFNDYCAKPCRECDLGGIVDCENHYKAEALYNAGYSRQSDGEWKDQYQGMYVNQLYKCSVCGETAFHDDKRWFLTKYCPNCGSKMKGGKV